MLPVIINNEKFLLVKNMSILSACKLCGIILPRFCFHENLPVAGNCRACLVELDPLEKPVASCVTDLEANQIIFTDSLFARRARENVLEILLANHPLDCPICDQAGECDLQDQSKVFGGTFSKFFLKKRSVSDKNIGFFIKTIMTRCIHCTRCVRFDTLICNNTIGILNRGSASEIGSYFSTNESSELSGNVIDLCPVGALTSRSYAFQTRP
jgi:NADH dehydrogenase/NADH:ubiquinone oxidoreductase subunit G